MTPEPEPVRVLREAALEALRNAGVPLRERGWDVLLSVDIAPPYDDHFCDVTLKIRIFSPNRIPAEARTVRYE